MTDMLFTGDGEAFNVGSFLESITPAAWASLGIGFCMGLSVVGAAWYNHLQFLIRSCLHVFMF